MAYDDTFSNIIQGLGNFSQGYMQGKRMREEDAMRRAQFDQQQKMAGLQYRQAEQRLAQEQQDRQIAEQSTALARATMTGDWDTASKLHYNLTDGAIAAVREHDADNVKIIRGDNTFSVVPKREYAEIAAAGNDPRLMVGAISRIMTAEARADLAAQNAQVRRDIEQQKLKARSEEIKQKQEGAMALKDLDIASRERIAKWRVGASLQKAAAGAGGATASDGGVRGFLLRTTQQYFEGEGYSPEEAKKKAVEQIILDKSSGMDVLKLQLRTATLMAESDDTNQAKVGKAMMNEINEELKKYGQRRMTGGTGATAAKPAAGGKSKPVDFSRMGFQRDPASGNYKNSKGIWFKNTDNGPVFWDKSTDTWKPVPKKSK